MKTIPTVSGQKISWVDGHAPLTKGSSHDKQSDSYMLVGVSAVGHQRVETRIHTIPREKLCIHRLGPNRSNMMESSTIVGQEQTE